MASNAHECGKAAGYAQRGGVATASHWKDYTDSTRSMEGPHDWNAELADFSRGFEAGVALWKAEHPFSVTEWCSHPDAGNDDCGSGEDFATLAEARKAYLSTAPKHYVAFVLLDGPDVHDVRPNPHYRASRDDDSEGLRERAMQAGMAFGCAGYNDVMGY